MSGPKQADTAAPGRPASKRNVPLYLRPLVFLFITVPGRIYMILGWMFFPLGLALHLFNKPFALRVCPTILFNYVMPVLLMYGIPAILFYKVTKSAGWLFFLWMLIYFITRRFTGIEKATEATIEKAKRESEEEEGK